MAKIWDAHAPRYKNGLRTIFISWIFYYAKTPAKALILAASMPPKAKNSLANYRKMTVVAVIAT
jgi:hypothetical protein